MASNKVRLVGLRTAVIPGQSTVYSTYLWCSNAFIMRRHAHHAYSLVTQEYPLSTQGYGSEEHFRTLIYTRSVGQVGQIIRDPQLRKLNNLRDVHRLHVGMFIDAVRNGNAAFYEY